VVQPAHAGVTSQVPMIGSESAASPHKRYVKRRFLIFLAAADKEDLERPKTWGPKKDGNRMAVGCDRAHPVARSVGSVAPDAGTHGAKDLARVACGGITVSTVVQAAFAPINSSIVETRAPVFAFSTTRQIPCFLASRPTADQ